PQRVQPLVSESPDVFYRLSTDNISGIEQDVIVPAREIIHDRYNCLFHPLIGLSPLTAAGLAAMQGMAIQSDSTNFFANKGVPSGILTAPGEISQVTADRLKTEWQANYSGKNSGKVAVLGDSLDFKAMAFNATDSQLIEQLKWSAEMVCSTFHVPPYKIGIGQMPTYNNIQALNIEYYSQGLQKLIEDAEICLDEGLGMKDGIGTEFDLDGLWRMDSKTQMEVLEQAKSV
ncbi:MAG TPA: phage portal protein, partial [Ochrobactrum anthropi]|nr:phage portal protein [Brucella anthropi]